MKPELQTIHEKLNEAKISIAELKKDVGYSNTRIDQTYKLVTALDQRVQANSISIAKMMGYGGVGGVFAVAIVAIIKALIGT